MQYLDTSVLVAALSNEATTGRIQAWLSRQDPSTLFVSDWTVTEFSSAMAIKLRMGRVSLADRAAVLALFNTLLMGSLTVLSVLSVHFRVAATFVDHHALGLRGGDALHLATAADHGATLWTLDRRLADAGPVLGIATQLLA